MAKQTSTTPTDIAYSFWLVFDSKGGMRMTRSEPGVSRDERAMSLKCTLPRSLFKVPSLAATINVDDRSTPPAKVDLKVAGAALKEATGIDFDLRIQEEAPSHAL